MLDLMMRALLKFLFFAMFACIAVLFFYLGSLLLPHFIIRKTKCSMVLKRCVAFEKTKRTFNFLSAFKYEWPSNTIRRPFFLSYDIITFFCWLHRRERLAVPLT